MHSRWFEEIRIGRLFRLDGHDYVKRSTRTARQLDSGRVVYFNAQTEVHPIAW